jgi:hypothetical protein
MVWGLCPHEAEPQIHSASATALLHIRQMLAASYLLTANILTWLGKQKLRLVSCCQIGSNIGCCQTCSSYQRG